LESGGRLQPILGDRKQERHERSKRLYCEVVKVLSRQLRDRDGSCKSQLKQASSSLSLSLRCTN
jgi:hypothetical protein